VRGGDFSFFRIARLLKVIDIVSIAIVVVVDRPYRNGEPAGVLGWSIVVVVRVKNVGQTGVLRRTTMEDGRGVVRGFDPHINGWHGDLADGVRDKLSHNVVVGGEELVSGSAASPLGKWFHSAQWREF